MDTLLAKNIVDAQTRVALDSLDKFVRIEKIVKVYEAALKKPAAHGRQGSAASPLSPPQQQ